MKRIGKTGTVLGIFVALSVVVSMVAETSAQDQALVYLPMIWSADGGAVLPTSDEISDDELIETVRGLETTIENLIDTSLPASERDLERELELLSDAFLSVPNVLTTVVIAERLFMDVILTNGQTITVINNRPDESTALRTGLPDELESIDDAGEAKLVGSRKAVVATFDGGAETAAKVKSRLEQKGYQVLDLTASIFDMQNYKDLGLLYLDTHGASFNFYRINAERKLERVRSTYALQTSTTIEGALLPLYKDEIEAQEVALSLVVGGGAKFAITEKFIEKHWSFDEGVAFIHSCFLGSGPFKLKCGGLCDPLVPAALDPTPYRQAMFNQGADLVVSYDNFSNTGRAEAGILYFFDRMLGLTAAPQQQPFDWENTELGMIAAGVARYEWPAVWQWLQEYYNKYDNLTRTVNVVGALRDSNKTITLVPIIDVIEVKDDGENGLGRLILKGNFGDEEGTVDINGVPVTVNAWSNTEITVDTPLSGPSYLGEVFVRSQDGIESNGVMLTGWTGELEISFKPSPDTNTLQAKVNIEIAFRGDVHGTRIGIDETSVMVQPSATYFNGVPAATVQGLGAWTIAEGVTESWTGTGNLDVFSPLAMDLFETTPLPTDPTTRQLEPVDPGGRYGGKIYLDKAAGKATVCMIVRGFFISRTEAAGQQFDTGRIIGVPYQDNTITFEESAEELRGSLGCYDVGIKDNYEIEGFLFFGTVEESEYVVEMSTLTPTFPPDY